MKIVHANLNGAFMKKQILSITAVLFSIALILSCSGKKEQKIPEDFFKPLPDKIEVSQADTCVVDTFLVDTVTIDTSMLENDIFDSTVAAADTILTDSAAVPAVTDDIKNDLKELGLKGKVRSFTEETFKAADKFGEIVKGNKEGISRSVTFYANGMIAEDMYISPDGKISSIKRNMYDNKGNKIENVYNSDGKINNTKKIIYDDNGNITEESIYNSSGILESKYSYKYGAKGDMTEQNIYNSEGNKSGTELYSYDDNGNKTEENIYNSTGDLTDSHKFVSDKDENGNLVIKDIFKTEDGEYTEWQKFDAAGNKIEEGSGRTEGKNNTVTTFKYDGNGNAVEEYCNDPEQYIKYQYEYDSRGNWIKKIVFEKKVGIPQLLTERKIIYFD
jgi:hypothetical protein